MDYLQNNTNTKFLYCSLSALPVVLGGAAIIFQGGLSLYGALVGIFLISCGVGAGLFLWRRHAGELEQINSRRQQDRADEIQAIVAYTSELERLLLTISPILSQHVMVSREHTEQEIISLTRRFAEMVEQLRQIVNSADNTLGGSRYHLDNVIGTSRELLQPVTELLHKVHKGEHDVLAELQKLSGRMAELKNVTADVSGLSTRMNRLALSLSEVSADDGQNRRLAAATDEAEKLAHSFALIGGQLAREIEETAAVTGVALQISESAQLSDAALVQVEASIEQTLSHLGLVLVQYRDDASLLRNNAEQIQTEINNVLVALQFQDRVSQILTQVENNLLNLQKTIETIQQQGSERDGNMLKVDEAVEHIEENYKSVSSRSDQATDNSDELTFF